jgi:CHAT domain-containing protein
LAGLIFSIGCHSLKPSDPAASFARIHAEFLHGQLDLALQEASAEQVGLLQSDPVWSYRFLLLEGDVLQFQGRSHNIVDLLDHPNLAFHPDSELVIKRDLLLSLAEARLGQKPRSAEAFEEAQQLDQKTHSSLQGEILRLQGQLENRNGEKAAAEASLTKSLEIARHQGNDFLAASDLLNLGTNALQSEHIDEALDISKTAAVLAAKIHADLLLMADQGNAGSAYYGLGDFEGALDSFRQAEGQARHLGATDSQILWLKNEGLALSRLGDLNQAQSSYEQALKAAQGGKDAARVPEIESSLALLFLQLNQKDAAQTHADRAFATSQMLGAKPEMLNASLIRALVAARSTSSPETEKMLQQVLQDATESPSIRWQAQDALANLYATRRALLQADSWHRRSIQTFEAQRASVQDEEQKLPFLANGDELYRDYAEFLIATGRSEEALRVLDNGRAKTLKEGLGAQRKIDVSQLYGPSTLARRDVDVVLFYSLGPQKSYLWVIDHRGTHLFMLPPEPEIAGRIKSYQASILRSSDPLADANPDALWLYQKLVAPAESLIPANSRVMAVPDGSMNGFNLETLLTPGRQGNHYWIDDISLTTAASLQILSHTDSSGNSKQIDTKLLLIGDPLAASTEYAALPHAQAEIEDVQHHFPATDQTTLTRSAAVPTAYAATHPEQFAYLHFVAHGMASTLRPLDSAIVLSPPSGDPNHFKLYARDIIAQPLNARLVTISACYGNGVRNYAGEGMVGLTWAFLRAGAHQVIGTLWEVSDSSTPQLMDQMYRGLSEGTKPDQALRAAKLSMLHSQGVFRKPLYWAAFQLYTGS